MVYYINYIIFNINMYMQSNNNFHISLLNSTNTSLVALGEYLGRSENVSLYNYIVLSINCDVKTSLSGVQFKFSQDNINWNIIYKYTYKPNILLSEFQIKQDILSKYFRIRYINSTDDQSFFKLQITLYSRNNDFTLELLPIENYIIRRRWKGMYRHIEQLINKVRCVIS